MHPDFIARDRSLSLTLWLLWLLHPRFTFNAQPDTTETPTRGWMVTKREKHKKTNSRDGREGIKKGSTSSPPGPWWRRSPPLFYALAPVPGICVWDFLGPPRNRRADSVFPPGPKFRQKLGPNSHRKWDPNCGTKWIQFCPETWTQIRAETCPNFWQKLGHKLCRKLESNSGRNWGPNSGRNRFQSVVENGSDL